MMAKRVFKKGDKVWFISKYGNRVSGIYEEATSLPGLDSKTIQGHTVISDNAFGPGRTKGVRCFVSDTNALHAEGADD